MPNRDPHLIPNKDPHLVVEPGMVALRVCKDDRHFDVAVSLEVAHAIVSEHGRELMTDQGLQVFELEQIFALEEAMDKVEVAVEAMRGFSESLFREAPHLKRFEYPDRPLLDLGPVARPRPSQRPHRPGARKLPGTQKRRKKNKSARKSRKRNRR